MEPQPITLFNTALPLGLLGLAGITLPRLVLPRQTRTLSRLAWVSALCVPVLFLFAMAIFAAVRTAAGTDLAGALAAAPAYVMGDLAWTALMSSLVWGPALILSALSLAQRIERLKGEDMARQGR
jgi:hypothetical protein